MIRVIKYWLCTICLFAIILRDGVVACYGQTYHDSIIGANEQLYRLNFSDAESEILKLKNNHPADYLPELLYANYYWWQIITGHDSAATREQYYKHLDSAIAWLPHRKENISDDTLYALITGFAYKARIHSMNNEYFAAIGQLNNCIDYVKQSFGKETQYEWFCLTSGLYNYYIEAVKKNYPFLLPYLIFLPAGNLDTGIRWLQNASSSGNNLLSTEATYFMMKIYLEEEKKYKEARKYSQQLIQKYPANLLYRYYHFRTYLDENKPEDAARELGMMNYYADKNTQLSAKQKMHFQNIAKGDLKKFWKINR